MVKKMRQQAIRDGSEENKKKCTLPFDTIRHLAMCKKRKTAYLGVLK